MLWRPLISFLVISLPLLFYGQYRPVGTWKYYFNGRQYPHLEQVGNNLLINAQRVILDLKPKTEELAVWDRINRLSEYSIATMAYDSQSKRFLIVYENSTIDNVLYGQDKISIKPNFDINNKILVADKKISQVKFIKNRAYLCSKVGIIVYDYQKNEIQSTYIIGASGGYEPVNSLELWNGIFYACTNRGIKIAKDIPANNLQNFSNWSIDLNYPRDSFIGSVINQNNLYLMSAHRLIEHDAGGSITELISPEIDTLRILKKIRTIGNSVYVLYDTLNSTKGFHASVLKRITPSQSTLVYALGNQLHDFNYDSDGKLYVTGQRLYRVDNMTTLKVVAFYDQPYENTFRLQQYGKQTYVNIGVMQRNLDASLNGDGAFVIENNWVAQSGIWNDSFRGCTNQLSYIPFRGGAYRAFVRGGITYEKNNQVRRFYPSNSTLEDNGGVIRISDMVMNPYDSSIWISNPSSRKPLKCLTKDGTWYSFDLSSVTTSSEFFKIIIDQSGSKWILTRGSGLILFNEGKITDPSDDILKVITILPRSKNNQCELSVISPLSATVDLDGSLWVGAGKGIGRISGCTWDPKADCELDAPILNILDPNDTTIVSECAFLNTPVTAIAVDAGNNIWVGTPDGVFYTRENMDIEYLRLNKLNSPLAARSIYDILVHSISGEVFFSTDLGLLSYMGQSIEGERFDSDPAYLIIPNPVPSDYTGLISIDGLPENAFFKITDVIGNLIYQGKSNGSRVVWDGITLSGVKAPTGVYFIFSGLRNLQGKTSVGKFTIIR